MSVLCKSRKYLISCFSGLILVIGTEQGLSATTDFGNSQMRVPHLAVPQLLALQYGETSVTGDNGQYVAKVLVKAPTDKAWAVLTDYDNFKNFLPNVSDSKLLSVQGNRKVFEQVTEFQVFLFTKRARVRISTSETYPQQIDFQLVEGDVKSLSGAWQLTTPAPNLVLITHRITVDPGSNNRGLFFHIYKNSLKNTLTALKKEIESRPN